MKIIIIGGGFAGLELARKLNNHPSLEILLIDKSTFHQFQPLLYQVATGGLEPTNVSFPFRKIFQESKNVRIRIAEVLEIKANDNLLVTDIGEFEYDKLVIATGTTTNFFDNDKIKALSFPMKTTLEAVQLLNRVINNFEDALDLRDDKSRSARMSIAIVGAGPTGVELAGALAEMKSNILPKDYPDLDLNLMNIYLVNHGRRPLGAMSAQSGIDSERYLNDMGITLISGKSVSDFDTKQITLDNGEVLAANTLIWAAGVTGALPKGLSPELIVRGNRLIVDRFNNVEGMQDIYAIGDISIMKTPKYPNGHPQLASVAKGQGRHLAENFKREIRNKPLREFEFVDKGVMATVGKRNAVVDLPTPRLHINGRLAWFIWMFLHLFLILGIKNKIQVFINWVYKYFTADQSLRLAQRVNGHFKSIDLN